MAETTGGREAATIARRPSFRQTLRAHAETLPQEYLDALEQKRKQLDDSIHKYIASKEREYRQYEREVKQQARGASASSSTSAAPSSGTNGNGASTAQKRRTSSESTAGSAPSPFLAPQQSSAVNALLNSGSRRNPVNHAIAEEEEAERPATANLKNRRASAEREKDFVGLFTPPYLPLIDHKDERTAPPRPPERAESAPSVVEPSKRDTPSEDAGPLPKADSETAMYAKYGVKRPVHLQQLAKRTSSSGSSADGRLASAMKSPSQALQRPKRKRVSLAVGDSIVAPSDNVPLAMNNSSTPSHSRTRSPETEREKVQVGQISATVTLDFAKQPATASSVHGQPSATANTDAPKQDPGQVDQSAPTATPAAPRRTSIDPDGDLFDLEDELDDHAIPSDDFESTIESDEDTAPGITGRIAQASDNRGRGEIPMPSPGLAVPERHSQDGELGLIPESTGEAPTLGSSNGTESSNGLSVGTSSSFSSHSSKQPTSPGFRRPTVEMDPVFRGTDDYFQEEALAADDEVYASSFTRPTKGSFTGGSLGESYMQKHAEEMMKARTAKMEQSVR